MDLWTFQRFQQPRLCVDAIHHDHESAVVSLVSGNQTYRLAFDDMEAASHFVEELKTLGDSAAPLWATLRESPPSSSWHMLGTFLDTHSLISESRDDAAAELARMEERIRGIVGGTIAATFDRLPAERRVIAARHAAVLRRGINEADAARPFLDPDRDPFDAVMQPNFFLALLAVELEYFRRSSPLTLAAADLLLDQLASDSPDGGSMSTRKALSDAAGLYDERDLASHLWLIAHCMASSTGEEAARFPSAPISAPCLTSGLEFMRRTEIVTRATLALWGENPYVTAINKPGGTHGPLAAGPFIEQYYVTSRFVEIIAPLLSMRLSGPLRSMAFRYFSEEYGHEALESTTCEALGVAEATLAKGLPLPLHYAFVDALTLFADLDPITSFASIMVIEGIFGEPPRMALRLAAAARDNAAFRHVARDHEELNESLNHNSISRDMFERIKAVSPARQVTTMRRILFLLELNHRAWGGIAEFYGRQEELRVQGAFGRHMLPTE